MLADGAHIFVTTAADAQQYRILLGPAARLPFDPHDGVRRLTGLSFGTIVIGVGVLVLLLWIPLRQWPGLGTVANAVVIGLATDATLSLLDSPDGLVWRWVLLLGGILVTGLAGPLSIGSR